MRRCAVPGVGTLRPGTGNGTGSGVTRSTSGAGNLQPSPPRVRHCDGFRRFRQTRDASFATNLVSAAGDWLFQAAMDIRGFSSQPRLFARQSLRGFVAQRISPHGVTPTQQVEFICANRFDARGTPPPNEPLSRRTSGEEGLESKGLSRLRPAFNRNPTRHGPDRLAAACAIGSGQARPGDNPITCRKCLIFPRFLAKPRKAGDARRRRLSAPGRVQFRGNGVLRKPARARVRQGRDARRTGSGAPTRRAPSVRQARTPRPDRAVVTGAGRAGAPAGRSRSGA